MADRKHSWKPAGGNLSPWIAWDQSESPPTTTALTGARNGIPVLSRYDPAARHAVERRRQELMTAMMLISRAAIAEPIACN